MKKKNKVVIATLGALFTALVLLFYKGLDKIKELDLTDPFDFEEDDD